MRPDDASGRLPPDQRPIRVLIVSGSQRRQYNCPGVDAKSRMLMLRMAESLPGEWEIDYEDLGNVYGRAKIQSCNACVSTSMALCVWPCNCYEKNDSAEPDLMWDLDMYARLDVADAWAIIGPINWYAPSSNLKLMFDRLVCANGGNPDESLIDHKDPEKAMNLEQTPEWELLSVNHLEGRSAGFFCYGDLGANEIGGDGRPRKLRHDEWFDPSEEPFGNERESYAPLVWQCRFSGIEVPDELWAHASTGVHQPYSANQSEDAINDREFIQTFDEWVVRFAAHVRTKGTVTPGRWRAFGFEPPTHRIADARLKWRDLRMSAGRARSGSSPRIQYERKLNEDATFNPEEGEGAKLRKKRPS